MKVIEDFVPFQMAIKLKEKGLILSKEYIFGAYDEDGDLFSMLEYNIEEYWCAYAPTIAQSLKWLRETKNIEVVASFSYRNKVWGYQVGDMTLLEDSILSYDYSFPTYEKATIAGIEYVVNNLI